VKSFKISKPSLQAVHHKQRMKKHYIRSKITDIDMSVASMVSLSFKWLIASITVGFVLFIVYMLLITTALRF